MRIPIFLFVLSLLLLPVRPDALKAAESDPGQKVECEEEGGKWEDKTTLSGGQCNLPTLDSGKICNDSSECESACVAAGSLLPGLQTTGICYGWSLLEGECLNPVKGGVTQGSTCEE